MDYQITKPIHHIEQPKATQTIEQPAAIVEINTTDGQLKIDSSQARRDLGLIGPFESVKNYAKEGQKKMLEGISRRVSEGEQMKNNAGKGQGRASIQNIAKQNHGPHRPGPYNIKFIPSIGSVKVEYTPGTTDINITKQDPKIDVRVNKPIIDYTAGDVNGTMIQRPHVNIDVID